MAQTPTQRIRNAQFTKAQDASRGKPEAQRVIGKKKVKELKNPIPPLLMYVLGFAIFGGLFAEILRRFF